LANRDDTIERNSRVAIAPAALLAERAAKGRSLSALQSMLATGVATAALFAYSGRPARAAPPAGCTSDLSGTVVTCSGDQSAGVLLNNASGTYTTLNVNNLTTNINPAAGFTGVQFSSNGPVQLNVNPGPFAIFATDANGIFASSNGGAVTIDSTADIVTTGGSATGVQGSAQNELLTITSSGNIATSGNNSFGIAAGTVYGDIVVNSSGAIATSGTFSAGINIGSIGSLPPPPPARGAITINSSGDIATTGTSGIGINVASVYGPVTINSMGNIAVSGTGSIGINVQTEGEVEITSTGNIAAGPASSVGILALSQLRSVLVTSTGDIATAGQTGRGIYVRAGETATVLASGSITTLGDNAAAIAASGDTGTVVVSSATIRTFGTAAPGITAYGAGDVAVASMGHITTTGATSDGINVVSTNGMAVVVNTGDIAATGVGSAGIYAAGDNGTSVINFGAITGCPCGGVILRAADGDNILVNFGTITAELNGSAIEMDIVNGGNLVENFGTVTGNVFMSGATGVFENRAGAFFNPGDAVIGDISNDGMLAPGGSGTVETTGVGGALRQSGSGTLAVDVAGGAADKMVVLDVAELAGKVSVSILSFPTLAAYTIVDSASATNNGLSLIASPALHATLQFTPTDVILGINVDFSVDGLNPNQLALAGNLDKIYAAGGAGVTPVLLGLLNVDDLSGYKSALNQLMPEIYSNAEIATLYSSLAFANSLLSCRINGAGTAAIIREGQCLWAGASANFLDAGTTSDQIGFTQTSGLFNAGAQVALGDVWRLGFGAGYMSSTLQTATGAESDGAMAQAGVSLKYNPGALLLAGVINGGGARYDTTRPMAFGNFSGVAEGQQDLGIISGSMRAAYVLGSPQLYYKPILDLGLTHIALDAFSENGGGGAALMVAGSGQTVFTVAPTLEIGSEWWMSNGTLIRPLIRGGAVLYEGADFALTSSFVDAPAGVGPFVINTEMDQVVGTVGVGLEVISGSDAVMRFSYDAQLGETTQVQSVGIKGSARF
jgi:uncharacterized protein with beta-barrel porin domain